MSRPPATVPDETGTLSPRVLLRCSGCGLRWTAATLDPATCPACGRREEIALVRRFGAGTMSLQAGPSPALVESFPRPGTPTPDHERPAWHVTDVTPASDAARRIPAGQCTRDTPPGPPALRVIDTSRQICRDVLLPRPHQCTDRGNKRQLTGHSEP
ncbi:hypothetical protein [Methanoculleus sp. 7T]|uniref:hypothetical protein n=1 Tax=Methanoculleus sp. 7T TaxID=2937282 RepID=UPI0020C158B1|nr:hypothetical protein [Methanoculleus sp. 7T]MCK8519488.1 hypothetical protein [Methanoculleus sp. 7T]